MSIHWVKSLFTDAGAKIVSAVSDGLDKLFTSDHELALTDLQKEKIKAVAAKAAQDSLLDAEKETHRHVESLESEITKRLAIDSKTDSWLAKNIRPLSLCFTVVATTLLAFTTVFSELKTDQIETLELWTALFSTLMVLQFTFYFGGRTIEKSAQIVTRALGGKG